MARRITWTQIVLFGVAVVVLQAVILWPLRTACAIDITPERVSRLYDQFPDSVIPIWALSQYAPVEEFDARASLSTASYPDWIALYKSELECERTNVGQESKSLSDCPPAVSIGLPSDNVAIRIDSARLITELYVQDFAGDQIVRIEIDSSYLFDSEALSVAEGYPWIARDLDLDGNTELVIQGVDDLTIYSSPGWIPRGHFAWPGFNVVMNPVDVNLDDDPFVEVFVTPHTLGGTARAVVIDYDPVTDSFKVIVDIPAPIGAAGRPAFGDFDSDSRIEFICGNYGNQYGLFEWQVTTLAFIGSVGDTFGGYYATSCRPKPGDTLCALLGHSSRDNGFRYQLLKPVGDNSFIVCDTFQEVTGATGIHPCWAADIDCDGLDEISLQVYPLPHRVIGWDTASNKFVQDCEWDFSTYGTLINWFTMDVDLDGAKEFGATNHEGIFRVFPGTSCTYCDSLGYCATDPPCYCQCHTDPECDTITNVFDVVAAVDVAFRSAPEAPEPSPLCPFSPSDVTCDSLTDVFDVVALVDVAFRSADPAVTFCNPCD